MARAKAKRKTRRRMPSFSLINAFESYIYADILMRGATGTGPYGFLTGEGDLKVQQNYPGAEMTTYGANEISLRDILQEPGTAFSTISANLRTPGVVQNMFISSLLTSASFRVGKYMLRKPINNVNRNIVRPLFGKAVRL